MNKFKIMCMSAAIVVASACPVFAQENILDINTAVNKAIENSYTIKSQQINLDKLKNSYDDIQKNSSSINKRLTDNSRFKELRRKGSQGRTEAEEREYREYEKIFGSELGTSEELEYVKVRDNVPMQYKNSIYKSTNNIEVLKNQIKASIYNKYNNLLNTKEALELEEKKFKTMDDEYKKSEMQLNLGLISKAQAKPKESSYYAEKEELNKLKRSYDIQTMDFNKSIGVDSNVKYIGFKTDNRSNNPVIKSYDEYLNMALTNRAEILNDKDYIKLKEFEYKTISAFYPSKVDGENKDATYYISQAEDKLETDKIDISIEINRLYNDLQNKVKKLESVNKSYDLAKKEYDKSVQKYNLGVISKMELDSNSVDFKSQQNVLNVSERDVWLAQLNLEYASNLGLNISN